MIVASGYNVSPVEVEELLLSDDRVADCGVRAATTARGDTIVKAFIVLADVDPSDELTRRLQEFVQANLAVYKCPREIAYVSALPRTANGKLRRRAMTGQ
jgi:acyl-coenzyme A synthetase/AMP-(fatty) acid ligase